MILLFIVGLLFAFSQQENTAFTYPKEWSEPVYDFKKNPYDVRKIQLGRALFYDNILSADQSVSCASCHSPYNAFAHVDHALSHGIHDSIGKRNSPALMNLAWQNSFMWDGAIHYLDQQALAPISHPSEMGSSITQVVNQLRHSSRYRKAFEIAYGDTAITGERVLKSMSQFMLSLVSSNSHYDKVMRKEESFTEQEQKGYIIYKRHCSSCHKEPFFTSGNFERNGLLPDEKLKDYGRMNITNNKQDSLLFKVPTLRNIEFTYPYMHDGRFKTISQVLQHYQQMGEDGTINGLKPFTNHEKVELMAFLLSLSDKDFLFNKDFGYPHDFFKSTAQEK